MHIDVLFKQRVIRLVEKEIKWKLRLKKKIPSTEKLFLSVFTGATPDERSIARCSYCRRCNLKSQNGQDSSE